MHWVSEEACRTSESRSVADDDENPRLTSGERLATMERYGFSSFTKSKPPLHAPVVIGTANGVSKLFYLNVTSQASFSILENARASFVCHTYATLGVVLCLTEWSLPHLLRDTLFNSSFIFLVYVLP